MSEKLEVFIPWNEAVYMKGAKIAYDYTLRHSWKRYIGWLFIAMTQFGVVAALQKSSFGLLFLSTALVLYWYYIRWPLRKMALRRLFSTSGSPDKMLKMIAKEDGLCIDDRCIPWKLLIRTVSSKEGYLLDMPEGFLFLPKNCFKNEEIQKKFSALFRQKIEKFEKI